MGSYFRIPRGLRVLLLASLPFLCKSGWNSGTDEREGVRNGLNLVGGTRGPAESSGNNP